MAVATFGNERWLPHLYGRRGRRPQAQGRKPPDPRPEGRARPDARRALAGAGRRATWALPPAQGRAVPRRARRADGGGRPVHLRVHRQGRLGQLAGHGVPPDQEHGGRGSAHPHRALRAAVGRVRQQGDPGPLRLRPRSSSPSGTSRAASRTAERQPAGTGPWKFVEHVRGDRIVYEAVDGHWRATPHWKRLVFIKVPEPATRHGDAAGGQRRRDRGRRRVRRRAQEGRRADDHSCRTCRGCTSSSAGSGRPSPPTIPRCRGRSPTPSARARCAWP